MKNQNKTIDCDSNSAITENLRNLSKQPKKHKQVKYTSPNTQQYTKKRKQHAHVNFKISTNFGIQISFNYDKSPNEHIIMQANELYIEKIYWTFDADYVFKKSQSKNKKTFGTEMKFLLNHPLQLANKQEISYITAKFIRTQERKLLYHSPIGIIIKIEQLHNNYYPSSIQKEYEIQQHNPIGITPIANITPNKTTTKIYDYYGQYTNKECITCMQVYKPVNVQSFLDQLLNSQKSENKKLKTFSTLFVTLYVNLVFQTIVNIENSILPGNWTLTNLSLSDSGLITIDFEDFRIITHEITISQQAHIIKSSFQHFFKQILDFCETSQFHYEKMNTILITLHKWNEDMCQNFESGTLHKTWQAPMFTPTLLELIAQTFEIELFPQTKKKLNFKWKKIKLQYNIPNIHFFLL